jgi:hypothetical protein
MKAQINNVERKAITFEEYNRLFSDHYWYSFYFDLKAKEENISLTSNLKKIRKKFLLKLLSIYKERGLSMDQYNLYFNNLIYNYSQKLHFNPGTSNRAKFYLKNGRIPKGYEEMAQSQTPEPTTSQIITTSGY